MFKILFHASKTIVIKKPVTDVYQSLTDFNQWKHWSPWLYQEPQCPVTIKSAPHTVGHTQEWNGEMIGSGRMIIETLLLNKNIHFQLQFLKPWKSQSTATMELQETEEGTHLFWSMNGELPFFLFFLKRMMIAYIGHDMHRGLMMFKEYIESGIVSTKTRMIGTVKKNKGYYFGIRTQCPISELSAHMSKDFGSLMQLMNEQKVPSADQIMSLTHDFNLIKGVCDYSAILFYNKEIAFPIPSGMIQGEIPSHEALQADHFGPYHYLGNGWATLMNILRFKKIKQNKAIPFYEVYRTFPTMVKDMDVHTELLVPVNINSNK